LSRLSAGAGFRRLEPHPRLSVAHDSTGFQPVVFKYFHFHITAGRGSIDSFNDALNLQAKSRPLSVADNDDRDSAIEPSLFHRSRQITIRQLIPALLCRCSNCMALEVLTDWDGRSLIENNSHLWRVGRGFIETTDGELDYRLHLISVQPLEPFHDVVNIGSGFQIFEDGGYQHRVPFKTHAPLTLPGTLSTAGHCDQSRIAMFLLLLLRSLIFGLGLPC